MHPYTSMTKPLPTYPVSAASGVHIHLEDGRDLIDGMSSWWAAVHGYKHPVLDKAAQDQLGKMSHVMFGGLTHQPATDLAKLLVDITPEGLNKVFFSDSGSVSVEVAMKMAIQYWYTVRNGDAAKSKFISLRHGYHGDTFGAMSVCDPENGMHGMFRGVLAQQLFTDAPRDHTESAAIACADGVEKLLQSQQDEVAAVILEPIVQGAGGMRFYSPALLKRLRELCDQYDALLIFDEIATGFGRTGTMFACEHSHDTFQPWVSPAGAGGESVNAEPSSSPSASASTHTPTSTAVTPDIICLGKALTGGYLTLGATLAHDKVCRGISPPDSTPASGGVFMHGPTFMGNPLACAVALASLRLLLDSPWQQRVASTRQGLISSLSPAAELDSVREVRGWSSTPSFQANENLVQNFPPSLTNQTN